MSEISEIQALLLKISNRLLFPLNLLKSLKEKAMLNHLSHCMEKYNQHIIEARNLLEKIKRLDAFKGLLNSKLSWNITINFLNAGFITWRDEILKSCINHDFYENVLLRQAHVCQKNVLMFLSIEKTSECYILNPGNKEIEYSVICSLLPRASYTDKDRYFVPEPIHSLEIDDLINK